MADWQEAVQASVIALIFALMVAKLVSVVISFRGENLRVERDAPGKYEFFSEAEEGAAEDTSSSSESENWDEDLKSQDKVREVGLKDTDLPLEVKLEKGRDTSYADVGLHPLVEDDSKKDLSPHVADKEKEEKPAPETLIKSTEVENEGEEKQSIEATGALSDSDGWEGVESSELDEKFNAASTFVATQAVGPGLKVANETQLLLYGLYKIATEGPCSTPQPPAYKLSARAKWNSWQKLGNIGSEEAMNRYIAVVSEISPSWARSFEQPDKQSQNRAEGDASQRGGMGPVFSSLVMNEEGGEGTLETIHTCAREGDQAGLLQQIEQGTSVDLKDSDGRTALHWAVDRGHLHTVELLITRGAQINAKDSEGQTALHYATTCEREEIAKYLVKEGAEPSTLDNDGVSPLSSRPGQWFWMGGTT